MSLTVEQAHSVFVLMQSNVKLVKIEACAGSGKTHTLLEMARAMNPSSGIYLAYNKAIADEAAAKFEGTNVRCSTIHSMAYRAVVKQWGLKIGWFNARDVQTDYLDYRSKKEVVAVLEEFLSSKHISQDDYFNEIEVEEDIEEHVRSHLDAMANGTIDSPHSFYLKMYHVQLALGLIPAPKTDLLMLDEFGDITAITLDIFRLIEADKKVAVGDSMQNIYSFNNTVNGFVALEGIGETIKFTHSFRVSDVIAARVQGFVRKHLQSNFEFVGREYPADFKVETKGYISRTNAGLLEEMLRLQDEEIAFHVTRKIDMILELPLVLANLGNGKRITNTKYKVIESHRAAWEAANSNKKKTPKDKGLLAANPTPLRYVLRKMRGDEEVSYGADIVMAHGPYEINALAKYVNDCVNIETGLTLTTAHSSKGLEFDMVEIAPDFNKRLSGGKEELIMAQLENNAEKIAILEEEFRLYYVACSRALVKLINAHHLPREIIG